MTPAKKPDSAIPRNHLVVRIPPKFTVAAESMAILPKNSMLMGRTTFAPKRLVSKFMGGPQRTKGT